MPGEKIVWVGGYPRVEGVNVPVSSLPAAETPAPASAETPPAPTSAETRAQTLIPGITGAAG